MWEGDTFDAQRKAELRTHAESELDKWMEVQAALQLRRAENRREAAAAAAQALQASGLDGAKRERKALHRFEPPTTRPMKCVDKGRSVSTATGKATKAPRGQPPTKSSAPAAVSTRPPAAASMRPPKVRMPAKGRLDEIGHDVYIVERLIDRRMLPGASEPDYLVRWKGYGPQDDTWEPSTNVLSAELLKEYEGGKGDADHDDAVEVVEVEEEGEEEEPAASWVQCDTCLKWRRFPVGMPLPADGTPWSCADNPDVTHNLCEVSEEEYSEESADEGFFACPLGCGAVFSKAKSIGGHTRWCRGISGPRSEAGAAVDMGIGAGADGIENLELGRYGADRGGPVPEAAIGLDTQPTLPPVESWPTPSDQMPTLDDAVAPSHAEADSDEVLSVMDEDVEAVHVVGNAGQSPNEPQWSELLCHEASASVPSPAPATASDHSWPQQKHQGGGLRFCRCSHHGCLKRYCPCFAVARPCVPSMCACTGCENHEITEAHREKRDKALLAVFVKHGRDAFTPARVDHGASVAHTASADGQEGQGVEASPMDIDAEVGQQLDVMEGEMTGADKTMEEAVVDAPEVEEAEVEVEEEAEEAEEGMEGMEGIEEAEEVKQGSDVREVNGEWPKDEQEKEQEMKSSIASAVGGGGDDRRGKVVGPTRLLASVTVGEDGGVHLALTTASQVCVGDLNRRLDVLRTDSGSGFLCVRRRANRRLPWVSELLGDWEPKPGYYGSLGAALVETVRRAQIFFGIVIFPNEGETKRAVAAELTKAPFENSGMERYEAYVEHARECMSKPSHVASFAKFRPADMDGAEMSESTTSAKMESTAVGSDNGLIGGKLNAVASRRISKVHQTVSPPQPQPKPHRHDEKYPSDPVPRARTKKRSADEAWGGWAANGSSFSGADAQPVGVGVHSADELPDRKDWMMPTRSRGARRVRVGSDYQVDHLPEPLNWVARSCTSSFDASGVTVATSPPLCRCELPSVRKFGRWWCSVASAVESESMDDTGTAGCAFELAFRPGQRSDPLCLCGRRATFLRGRYLCDAAVCSFEAHFDDQREPELLVASKFTLDAARATAALLTASAFGPINAWGFVAPTDAGLGLHARVPLVAGQFVCEYSGPRLPARLQQRGAYVLEVPGATLPGTNLKIVIDGASENSTFPCPRALATYANHSRRPNARLEAWPNLSPGSCKLRVHMMLVASEPIETGAEIRIDYENGGSDYWSASGQSRPPETDWRMARHPAPVPTGKQPIRDRLVELRTAAALNEEPPPCQEPAPAAAQFEPVPWEGADGGDARLRAVTALLAEQLHIERLGEDAWAVAATHVPGRSGTECKERWRVLNESISQEWRTNKAESAATAPASAEQGKAAQKLKAKSVKKEAWTEQAMQAHKAADQQAKEALERIAAKAKTIADDAKAKATADAKMKAAADAAKAKSAADKKTNKGSAGPGRLCGVCANCTRAACGACYRCLDMPRFGGQGKRKAACIYKYCLKPKMSKQQLSPKDPSPPLQQPSLPPPPPLPPLLPPLPLSVTPQLPLQRLMWPESVFLDCGPSPQHLPPSNLSTPPPPPPPPPQTLPPFPTLPQDHPANRINVSLNRLGEQSMTASQPSLLPPTSAPSSTWFVRVRVPEGVQGGQAVQVPFDSATRMAIVLVPDGLKAHDEFSVKLVSVVGGVQPVIAVPHAPQQQTYGHDGIWTQQRAVKK